VKFDFGKNRGKTNAKAGSSKNRNKKGIKRMSLDGNQDGNYDYK